MNKTILKWAGSKVCIMEQLRPYLPKTKRLVEPFAGSCAVMMNTDYEQYLIADVNNDLITMYQQIASDNIDEVIRTAYGL
ncbi:DNA adenine methylase, partial [Salmonella enterica subsp. enterica serovar Typhimurium]|nr:DNA adenine methylase [Salmonella enterica subsp. enterica serovar Typhimurium]